MYTGMVWTEILSSCWCQSWYKGKWHMKKGGQWAVGVWRWVRSFPVTEDQTKFSGLFFVPCGITSKTQLLCQAGRVVRLRGSFFILWTAVLHYAPTNFPLIYIYISLMPASGTLIDWGDCSGYFCEDCVFWITRKKCLIISELFVELAPMPFLVWYYLCPDADMI